MYFFKQSNFFKEKKEGKQKIFTIMKLSTLFLLIATLQIMATGYAQTVSLNLNMDHTPVRELLKEIERQTELSFIFSDDISSLNNEVSITVHNRNIKDVLAQLFKDTDLDYHILNEKLIVIAPKNALQGITITGTVTDVDGIPLPGASIAIKGTTQGTIADANGVFTLQVPNENVTLTFVYTGFTSQEVIVGNRRTINITLIEDTQMLEEVVVVGYGTQKKVNMTGAVSTVNVAQLEDRPLTNLASALAGVSPGLVVTQTAGARPGYEDATIRIRGQGTLNNSNPLIVIDGVISSLSNINPQDVEAISILKDASSAAIYGSRAANGVILITTRQGKSGTAKLTYQGSITAHVPIGKYPLVSNYAEFMELQNEAKVNVGLMPSFSQEKINEWRAAGNSDPIKYPNTDWQDAFYRTGWVQDHTLSASGGTDKIRFFLSGNILDNPGIIEHAEFKRYSFRANIDAALKPWLTVGVNLFGYASRANTSTVSVVEDFNVWGTVPGQVLKHPDGRLGAPNNPEDEPMSANRNPFRCMNYYKLDQPILQNKFVPRFYGIIKPLKGLSIEASYTYDYWQYEENRHLKDTDLWNFYTNTIARSGTVRTYIDLQTRKTIQNQMDAMVRYTADFNKLNIGVLLGANQEQYHYRWERYRKYDFLDPSLVVFDAAPNQPSVTGNLTHWAMQSYFGRLNLNWDEKYLFEANFRRDGSSRFSPDNRWGFFPSFSAGWRLSEESFLKDVSWLNALKLRLSYGSLGNNATSTDYMYQAVYSAANYVLNGAVEGGFAQTTLSDPNITWETTKVTNLGVDFGILNNRLNGSFELFNKDTEGILISLPAPLVHGTSTVPNQNAAKVNNKGFELNMEWGDRVGEVSYFLGGNFSFVKNEVTKFRGDVSAISGTNMLLEGQPYYIQYVLQVDRIVQTDEDMAFVQSLVDKNPQYFASYQRPEKGDFLYKDTNGDGSLTPDDRIMTGWGFNPQISYGISLGASWKGLDFTALLQGVARWKGFYQDNGFRFTTTHGYGIRKDIADGRWVEGRTDAKYPRLLEQTNTKNNQASDAFIFNKSFLRVKNIQLGYTLPQNISRVAYMDNVRLYISIDNAYTFMSKDFPGLDPELNAGLNYPTITYYSFGLNLTF